MTPNTTENLQIAICKLCKACDIDEKYFKVIKSKTKKPDIVIIKGKYIFEKTALFELERLSTIVSLFWFYSVRLRAKIETRGIQRTITLTTKIGEAPPA